MKLRSVLSLLTVLAVLALTGCEATLPGDDVPIEAREYAVYPITLAPDYFAMSIDESVNISFIGAGLATGLVRIAHIVNKDPMITECRDGGTADMYDCDTLERAGWIVMDRERAESLVAGSSGCTIPSGGGSGGGRVITLSVGSCFGLVRWENFHDTTGVVFGWEADPPVPYWHKPIRCGETWVGFRLKARSWVEGEYPVDEIFSDTVWLDVRGC